MRRVSAYEAIVYTHFRFSKNKGNFLKAIEKNQGTQLNDKTNLSPYNNLSLPCHTLYPWALPIKVAKIAKLYKYTSQVL